MLSCFSSLEKSHNGQRSPSLLKEMLGVITGVCVVVPWNGPTAEGKQSRSKIYSLNVTARVCYGNLMRILQGFNTNTEGTS